MHRVLLLGAGKIGKAIATYLSTAGDYELFACDVNEAHLTSIAGLPRVRVQKLDVSSEAALVGAMKQQQAVVSALPYQFNKHVLPATLATGVSYFDLTEDVAHTEAVRSAAREARPGQIFMPQCGLAPGFIGICGNALAQKFDRLDEIRLRVGALPLHPANPLKYNLTWSIDGLINEYGQPCKAIVNGRLHTDIVPLEGYERFSLEGVEYEAFNTSGGVGDLCDTYAGKVRNLDYKTVRYPGHRDLMAFLMNDLQMNSDRDTLKRIFERAIPATEQDKVITFCMVKGWKNDQYLQATDVRKIYAGEFFGMRSTAIQIATAAGVMACLDLHFAGRLPKQGFVRQEDVNLKDFLDNRFGSVYGRSL
ncbi:MAG: saccharopine dehydrogenase NADP-binding domain-containing protein [Phycisphaerae bacterium]|nr:saccharopine dehydrogenase NADP-binding domain-containing protein [Phycisphaerae bacterium]MDW8262744.1 saccharopine dehydrogenase NADP-binding domain-containing protein [Phycisphaerales bacterium]